MGKLADELRSERVAPGVKFRIDELLTKLNPEDRADLVAALKNPDIKTSVIARVLRRHGHSISEGAVRNYRESLNAVR